MSYQVLARKWRPKRFDEVVGQGHVVKALENSLKENKIHQAYLFSGTRGVGKTTIARILTKCLNCEKGLGSEPCDTCTSCNSITQGNFMDFHEVDAASRRGVEETQQLLETVAHMPGSSRYKVYLIDEVHMLSKHSFNALLKTLEEPPPHVVFILATTEPESVPATVLSRCLHFHLRNLTPSELSGHLTKILKEEGVKFDTKSISQLSRAGKGSLRDCLTITDQAIAYSSGNLNDKSTSEMLGTLPYENVNSLLESIFLGDVSKLLSELSEISQLGVNYYRLMDLLLETLQKIAIIKISPEGLNDSNYQQEDLIPLSNKISSDEVQILYQIGLMAKRDIDLAPDIGSGFEMALLRMLAFTPKEEINEETKKKPKVEKKTIKDSNADDKEDPNVDEIILDKLIDKEKWNHIFQSLDLDLGTKQLVSHCSFSRVNNEESIIFFSMPEEKLEFFNGNHRKKFQESINKTLNTEVDIFYEASKDDHLSPNKIKKLDESKEIIEAEKSLKEDEGFKEIMEVLDGKVIKSSVVKSNN